MFFSRLHGTRPSWSPKPRRGGLTDTRDRVRGPLGVSLYWGREDKSGGWARVPRGSSDWLRVLGMTGARPGWWPEARLFSLRSAEPWYCSGRGEETQEKNNDQVDRCCWLLSLRNFGASNNTSADTQPDGMITQVRFGCGPGRTRVVGVCVARTTIRHTRRMARRAYRSGAY